MTPTPSPSYLGFDRADCPDLPTMSALRAQTNLKWCAYYLHAPSQPAPTWRNKRAALVAAGWGLAPVYVGQQITGPGSHLVTGLQGSIDGGDAATQMFAEGFPPGSYCYLDLENGPPLGPTQSAYIRAWCDSLSVSGYAPGIYCSYLLAPAIAALVPTARLWVFHVRTASPHAVDGIYFQPWTHGGPSGSGALTATIWQYDDEARLMAFGKLAVDLDVSSVADPSAPAVATVAASVAAPHPAPGWYWAKTQDPGSTWEIVLVWATSDRITDVAGNVLKPSALYLGPVILRPTNLPD